MININSRNFTAKYMKEKERKHIYFCIKMCLDINFIFTRCKNIIKQKSETKQNIKISIKDFDESLTL